MALSLTSIFIVMAVLVIMAFAVFFMIRAKVSGKLLAFFIERDKVLYHRLFRPSGKFFRFASEDEMYIIDTECVVLVKYPFGGMMPAFIQQTIPCLLYAKGNPRPLDPKQLCVIPKGMTPKEISSAVNENIVRGIVKGVEEEHKISKFPAWLMPGITLMAMIILGVIMWGINSKIDSLIGLIKNISP